MPRAASMFRTQSEYGQIAAEIRKRLDDGTYPPGERIPPAGTLADEFTVTRQTINNALGALANQGLVRTERGIGTYAADTPEVVDAEDLVDYILTRIEAGDVLLFRAPDGSVDRVTVKP